MKITILRSLLTQFERKFDTWTRKFDKFGHGNFTYVCSDAYFVDDKDSRFYKKEVVDLEIVGYYKVADWEFVAALEYMANEGKNIVKKINDSFQVPEKYITSTNCEHCNTNHLRTHTILLRNIETGEFKQVGKACFKDYVGQDISDYARYLSFFDAVEDYFENCNREFLPREKSAFDTDEILLQTIAEADINGYISQAQYLKSIDEYGETSLVKTSTKIFHMMNETRNHFGELEFPKHKIDSNIENKLSELYKFIYSDDLVEDDYLRNIRILLNEKYTTNDNLGLVVSAVGFYIRETKKKVDNNSDKIPSDYIGVVGDKIEITGIPECLTSYETDFGVTHIYRFTVDNDTIIWKTGKYLVPGEEVTIKGTIKAHNEFRNEKQTEVTRCRVK